MLFNITFLFPNFLTSHHSSSLISLNIHQQSSLRTPSTSKTLHISLMSTNLPTVIIAPGNGCSNIRKSNWYGELFETLKEKNIPCICENFPDPYSAKRKIWIPHMRKLSNGSDNVILVGHSSGAQATLRYAEKFKCRAAILVAATFSDLNDPGERASGYYPQGNSNPYDFEAMKQNCEIWYQFHSNNDPFIPLSEAEQIRVGLGLTEGETYQMLPDHSHFFDYFPELLETIEKLL